MRPGIFGACRCCWERGAAAAEPAPVQLKGFNLREEYASAFRTKAYADLLARVTGPSASPQSLVDGLLDPDRATVDGALARARAGRGHDEPAEGDVLGDFFAQTADASRLCGALLEDIDRVRRRCRSLGAALDSDRSHGSDTVREHLADFSNASNPFSPHAASQLEFRSVQSASTALLRRLDSERSGARARLRSARNLRRRLAVVLLAATATASLAGIFAAFHAVLVLAALPPMTSAPRFRRAISTRRPRRDLARLEAAAKGAYILSMDLQTISRLVARLHDDVEHMLAMARFWSRRRGRPVGDVVQRLRENEACFDEQLEELEEHLFLFLTTINKARSLVVKEIQAN